MLAIFPTKIRFKTWPDVWAAAGEGTALLRTVEVPTENPLVSLPSCSEDRLVATLSFLSLASKKLAAPLDVARALREVADAAVPAFADGMAVSFEDDGPRHVVAATGRVPPFDRTLARSDATPPSVLDCELLVRDRRLGTLRVARLPDRPAFDGVDRLMFEELALRAAVAIDADRTLAREHRVADTLQRALLPESLPASARYRFDAAYLAGAKEAVVGGDWYDAFTLPDGRVAFSIGDVAGHGLQAAIVVGEVRQTVRAAALTADSPAEVLERANAMVNMRAEPVMVTTIFGTLDPATSTVTYASAGHPAPVMVTEDLRAELLPGGGVPLGIADAVGAANWTFTLPPGSLLALYTDGLIEYRRDVLEGEAYLLRALERELAEGRPSARSLLGRIFAFDENTDDAATLIVATAPDDGALPDFYYEFSAIPFAVPMVRGALRQYAHRLNLDDERTFALITAVGEAMANAVEHAYDGTGGNVRVRVSHDGGVFVATIEDFGRWKPAQKREERGRGLPLMRALADAVEIRTDQQCTTLSLRWGQTPAR